MATDRLYIKGIEEETVCAGPLTITTDLETVTTLFIYQHLKRPPSIQVCLISAKTKDPRRDLFQIQIPSDLHVMRVVHADAPSESKYCQLPAIVTTDATVISGLCSVCRALAKASDQPNILGFKRGCLAAPAESSVWTKYCEVDAIRFAEQFILATHADDVYQMARFEIHLRQPVRIHNIKKVVRELAQVTVVSAVAGVKPALEWKEDCDVPVIRHQFVEGPTLFLADLILYAVFYFVFRKVSVKTVEPVMPHTVQWYRTMTNVVGSGILDEFTKSMAIDSLSPEIDIRMPEMANISLYKSDPKRYKPRKRIFTKQQNIEAILDVVTNALDVTEITNENCETAGKQLDLDWSQYRGLPDLGQLPEDRLARKRDQLKSMAREIYALAHPGDVIVDFCCGSGHLGILVASMLPHCRILLLENKEESLDRAKERCKELTLANVVFLQSNLDYFHDHFDIGVSLHACGVATDLVLSMCLNRNADFVCSPCCYGGVHNMHHLTYPRSKRFRAIPLLVGSDDYFCIAHCADQSHDAVAIATCEKAKCDQGQFCMDVIDYDRRLGAEESGYDVQMTKMQPETCTQKNRLLIGKHRSRK